MNKKIIIPLLCLFMFSTIIVTADAQRPNDRSTVSHELYPRINPINPKLVAFERNGNIEIVDKSRNNIQVFTIECQQVREEPEDEQPLRGGILMGLEEEIEEEASTGCNYFDWRPVLDHRGNYWFTYTSRVDRKLYVGYINSESICYGADEAGRPITTDCHTFELRDAQHRIYRPLWSPGGQKIIFNEREGLYLTEVLYDNLRNSEFENVDKIELDQHAYYPAWSHDGNYIAYTYSGPGHQDGQLMIMDMRHPDGPGSAGSIRNIEDYIIRTGGVAEGRFLPNWSESGNYLSYLVPSALDDRWDVKVMEILRDSDGNLQDLISITGRASRTFARNIHRGGHEFRYGFPVVRFFNAEGRSIEMLVTIQADQDRYNPITIHPIESGGVNPGDSGSPVHTETVNNEMLDVVTVGGVTHMAFASQKDGRLQIGHHATNFDYPIRNWRPSEEHLGNMPRELSRNSAMLRSTLLPGLGQFYKGEYGKGFLQMGATALAATGVVLLWNNYNNSFSDFNSLKNEYEEFTIGHGNIDYFNKRYGERNDLFTNLESKRNTVSNNRWYLSAGVAALAGVYIYSVYDSRRGFPIWRDRDNNRQRLAVMPVVVPPLHGDYAATLRFQMSLN